MLRKWCGKVLFSLSDKFVWCAAWAYDAGVWITRRDRWSWIRGRRRQRQGGDQPRVRSKLWGA
jgi:hypothetical protein